MSEYIEREAFIEDIKVEIMNLRLDGMKGTPIPHDELYSFIDRIKEQPSAEVAPVVHGKWEECDLVKLCANGGETTRISNAGMKCTNCAHVFSKKLLWKENYCPNCGAKMDL